MLIEFLFRPSHYAVTVARIVQRDLVRDVLRELIHKEFTLATAIGQEQDLFAVGRPDRRDVARMRAHEHVITCEQILIGVVGIRDGDRVPRGEY